MGEAGGGEGMAGVGGSRFRLTVIPGAPEGRARNLEIPGSRFASPGMTARGG